jgi:hypothetical protein
MTSLDNVQMSLQEPESESAPDVNVTSGKDNKELGATSEAISELQEFQRPFGNIRWFFICFGLYLAGLLYGSCCFNS